MDKHTLTLEPRTTTGKKVKKLRKQGLVPASICGRGIQTETFQLDAKTFGLVYRVVGRTGLIELTTPSGTQSAFVRQVQRHPVSGQFLHVDFRIVDLRTPITADLSLVTVGENELIERGEGVLSLALSTIHVRALPADLPSAIEVDVSRLKDFHTVLHVRDLDVGDKVEVLTNGDEPVATLTQSRLEAEAEEIAEQIEGGDMEIASPDADNQPEEGNE